MKSSEIYKYNNVRSYLLAYAQETKAKRPQWSYAQWARKLELKGTASLTMILNGQRAVGPEVCEKLVRYFNFTSKERQYFLELVQLERLKKNPVLLQKAETQLQKLSPSKNFKVIDNQVFETISSWYHLCLREMVNLSDFKNDPKWIREKLRFVVSEQQIEKAIHTLLNLNLLARNEHGELKQADGHIDTSNDESVEAIKRFHEQSLENAKRSVRQTTVNEREITSSIFSVSSADLKEAKDMIRAFKREFEARFEKPSADATYQFNIQFIPLTKSGV